MDRREAGLLVAVAAGSLIHGNPMSAPKNRVSSMGRHALLLRFGTHPKKRWDERGSKFGRMLLTTYMEKLDFL